MPVAVLIHCWLMPTAGAASPDLVRSLLVKIQAMPMVDSHTHLPPPAAFREQWKDRRYDVVALLGGCTYVSEFTWGTTWQQVKANLAVNGHHAYVRPILEAFHDLYGLPAGEELTDENVETVSARMDAAHRKAGWYEEVISKRAGIAHLVWLEASNRGQADMPSPAWHPIWNVDGDLVFLAGKPGKDGRWPLDGTQEKFKVKLRDLKGMEMLIDGEIDSFFARGGVSLKSTAAYFRALDFNDAVPRPRATALFAKALKKESLPDAGKKDLEDYLMTRVLGACARHKKPFQFHTGNQQSWNIVANANPLGLNRLLSTGRWFEVKFVLLHGGYPFSREAIVLTREYTNVFLDLAWMALFSPSAGKQVLAEALDLLEGHQLMFGTDCANLEETYGTVKFTRRMLAEVLADKIEGGYWTEEVALRAARRVLHDNAMDLYGLKD